MSNKVIDIRKLGTILIISVAFLFKESINGKQMPWYISWLIMVFFLVFQMRYEIERTLFDMLKRLMFLYLIPYFFALIFTIIGGFWIDTFSFTRTRAISLTGQMILITFFASALLIIYRKDCINILADSMILYYLYSMILAVVGMGARGVMDYLINPLTWQAVNLARGGTNYLERHDLGAAVGLVILYYLFLNDGKRQWIRISLLSFIMYACHKRIDILAFFIALFAGVDLFDRKDETDKIFNHFFNIILISCFAYVLLIGSGVIYVITAKLGIGMSARRGLFNSVSRFYYISPFYPGKGFGFTEKYLSSIAGTDYAYKLGNKWMGRMHNEILRLYIELGAFGCALWFVYFLKVLPQEIKSLFGGYSKQVYFILMVYAHVSYSMDNTMDYLIFQLALYTILAIGCFKSLALHEGGCLAK